MRLGYGATILYVPDWSSNYNLDNINIGFELVSNKGVDLSLMAVSTGVFLSGNPYILSIGSFSLNLNYRPFLKWRLQPFIGAGLTYNKYDFEEYPVFGTYYLTHTKAPEPYTEGHGPFFNGNLGIKLKINNRFNFTAQATEMFGGVSNAPIPVKQTLFLIGSIGYGIHLGK